MTYEQWRAKHPNAAKELEQLFTSSNTTQAGSDESEVQRKLRLSIAKAGAMSWRNNVGATPARSSHVCPKCLHRFETRAQPVRYGLANDSAQLNQRIKSSDLILAIPRVIQPHDVGRSIAQFGAIETKRSGWKYTGKGREAAQAAWLALIKKLGGYAAFNCDGSFLRPQDL